MRNLVDINDLSNEKILEIIDLASKFEEDKTLSTCFGKHVVLMFFENSTRTHFSFEMAANKLGLMFIILIQANHLYLKANR